MQFVAKDRNHAQTLSNLLRCKLGTEPIIVTIGQESPQEDANITSLQKPRNEVQRFENVRTAVIPAAGFGTRLFPASRSIRPKALFPIVDADGFAKPLLLHLVEQCAAVGIERIIIVVGPGDQEEHVREMFGPVPKDLYGALKPRMREYADKIVQLSALVEITVQPRPKGFGDAVACAKVEEDCPFALLLGDVAFTSKTPGRPCLRQVLDAFQKEPSKSVIGVTQVPVSEAGCYGAVCISKDDWGSSTRVKIHEIVEKPSSRKAEDLSVGGHCSIVLGPYVFTPALMRQLRKDVREDRRHGGEIQLTPAIEAILREEGIDALHLDGEALDTGNAQEYVQTIARMGA